MNDRFEALETFRLVAEHHSFSKAAAELGIALSAVSRRVRELEDRLGVRLIHRTSRRVELTESGQRFRDRATYILAELRDAEAELAQAGSDAPVGLRVSAPTIFGAQDLVPALAAFMAEHPRATVEVSLDDRLVDLIAGRFDLALRIWRRPEPSALISRRLARVRYVVCASPSYLRRAPPIRELADLEAHRGIAYSHVARSAYWELRDPKSGALQRLRVATALTCDSGAGIRAAAIAGVGVTVLPAFVACEPLRTGALQMLFTGVEREPVYLYAVYPSRRNLHPTVSAMIRFVCARFAKDPWSKAATAPATR